MLKLRTFDKKDIENIESFGNKVGQYKIQNKILVTLNNSKNVNISKIKPAQKI